MGTLDVAAMKVALGVTEEALEGEHSDFGELTPQQRDDLLWTARYDAAMTVVYAHAIKRDLVLVKWLLGAIFVLLVVKLGPLSLW